MSQMNEMRKDFVPPAPADLMARYLQRQAEDHLAGLTDLDTTGEVQLYEAGPVQPIEARAAWEEAVAVVRYLAADRERAWKAPPGWPQLVAAHEPEFALAFCLGNFPQLVRNLQPLLQAADLSELRPTASATPANVPGLVEWAEKSASRKKFPEVLLALGALRLAKQFQAADRLLAACADNVPAAWQAAWDNEKAALAWHRGEAEQARRQWQSQPESVPVLFNRGMAALFLHQPAEAREALARVAAQVPETSAWHHLAQLYLTLVETRGQ